MLLINFSDDTSYYGTVYDDKGKIKDIQFANKKTGERFSYKQLSSGEKQIFYRGTFLLTNSSLLKGGVVLIDEPENDLHPKWQRKVLQFYKDIFFQKMESSVFKCLLLLIHNMS